MKDSKVFSLKLKKEQMQLYAVTDRRWTGRQTLLEQVREALDGGITASGKTDGFRKLCQRGGSSEKIMFALQSSPDHQ